MRVWQRYVLVALTLFAAVGLYLAVGGAPRISGMAITSAKDSQSSGVGPATALPAQTATKPQTRGRAIRRELETSSDVYATFQKYFAEPDPTGEIAYSLSRAISECSDFMYTLDEFNERMPFLAKDVLQSKARARVIERRIKQCAGFANLGGDKGQRLYEFLLSRAAAARYPGAVAETLSLRLIRQEPTEHLDAEAIRLLSNDPDDAVIKGVYIYLSGRNGKDWWEQFGDHAIASSAWTLLQCNFGAACDDSSRMVIMTCVYHAACDQHDVEGALPIWYSSLTPDKMIEVLRAEAYFASLIQNREWARLGLSASKGPASAKY